MSSGLSLPIFRSLSATFADGFLIALNSINIVCTENHFYLEIAKHKKIPAECDYTVKSKVNFLCSLVFFCINVSDQISNCIDLDVLIFSRLAKMKSKGD